MSLIDEDVSMSLVDEETLGPHPRRAIAVKTKNAKKSSRKPLRLMVTDPEAVEQEKRSGHDIGEHKNLHVCSTDFVKELKSFKRRNRLDFARQIGEDAKKIIKQIEANPEKATKVDVTKAKYLLKRLPSDVSDADQWEQSCDNIYKADAAMHPVKRKEMLMSHSNPVLRALGEKQHQKTIEAKRLAKGMTKSWKESHPGSKYVFQTRVDSKGQPVCNQDEQISYDIGGFKLFYNKAYRSVPVWRKHSDGTYVPFCTLPSRLRKGGLYDYFDQVSKSNKVPAQVRDQYDQLVKDLKRPQVAQTLMSDSSAEKNYLGEATYNLLFQSKKARNPNLKEKMDSSNGLHYFETLPPPVEVPVPGTGVKVTVRRPVRWYNLGIRLGSDGVNLARAVVAGSKRQKRAQKR